jgi:two-component system LytT family response regulator
VDYAISHSLTYLEGRLDPAKFVRLHRNSIANLREIASIEKGQNVSVTLRNGVTLSVSRERKAKVIELLG